MIKMKYIFLGCTLSIGIALGYESSKLLIVQQDKDDIEKYTIPKELAFEKEIKFTKSDKLDEQISLKRKETSAIAYKEVLGFKINAYNDWKTLWKIRFLNAVADTKPYISSKEIVMLANNLDDRLEAMRMKFQTGLQDPSRAIQATQDMLEIVGSVAEEAHIKGIKTAVLVASKTAKWSEYAVKYLGKERLRFEGQAEFYDEQSKLQDNKNSTLDDFVNKQSNNAEFKKAANIILAPILNSTIDDSAKKIFDSNPIAELALQTDEIIKEQRELRQLLADNIGPDGSLTLKIGDLQNAFTKGLGSVNTQLKGIVEGIREHDKKADDFYEYVRNRDVAIDKEKEAAKKAEDKTAIERFEVEAFRASYHTIGKILSLKDPEFGRKVTVLSDSIFNLYNTLSQYNRLRGTELFMKSSSYATSSTILMATNVIGISMTMMSLFSADNLSQEQLMMQQMQVVCNIVNQLRIEMHERFDRVEKQLNVIYSTIINGFHYLYAYLQEAITEVRANRDKLDYAIQYLQDAKSKLMIIQDKIELISYEVAKDSLNEACLKCLDFKRYYPKERITSKAFIDCTKQFINIATNIALNDSLINTEGFNSERDFEIDIAELKKPSYSNLGCLASFARLPYFRTSDIRYYSLLPNTQFWLSAANGFVQLVLSNIIIADTIASRELLNFNSYIQDIIKPGNEAIRFIRAIRKIDFIANMLQTYEISLQNLFSDAQNGSETNKLHGIWKEQWTELQYLLYNSRELITAADFNNLHGNTIAPCIDDGLMTFQYESPIRLPEIIKQAITFGLGGVRYCYAWRAIPKGTINLPISQNLYDLFLKVNMIMNIGGYDMVFTTQEIVHRYSAFNCSWATGHYPHQLDSDPWKPEVRRELNQFFNSRPQYRDSLLELANGIADSNTAPEWRNRLDPIILDKLTDIYIKLVARYYRRIISTLDNSTDGSPKFRLALREIDYFKQVIESFMRLSNPKLLCSNDLLHRALYGDGLLSSYVLNNQFNKSWVDFIIETHDLPSNPNPKEPQTDLSADQRNKLKEHVQVLMNSPNASSMPTFPERIQAAFLGSKDMMPKPILYYETLFSIRFNSFKEILLNNLPMIENEVIGGISDTIDDLRVIQSMYNKN